MQLLFICFLIPGRLLLLSLSLFLFLSESMSGHPAHSVDSRDNLWEAVSAVLQKKTSQSLAARMFGVKRSTVGDHVRRIQSSAPQEFWRKDKTAFDSGRHAVGRSTVIHSDLEQVLVERALLLADRGFPITKKAAWSPSQDNYNNIILYSADRFTDWRHFGRISFWLCI